MALFMKEQHSVVLLKFRQNVTDVFYEVETKGGPLFVQLYWKARVNTKQ